MQEWQNLAYAMDLKSIVLKELRVRVPSLAPLLADVAQLAEQLICNQQVVSSILIISSMHSCTKQNHLL